MWMWLLWTGCSGTTESTDEGASTGENPALPGPTPDEFAAALVKVEKAFVHGSLLRLRPEPRSDTATYESLAINTPLRVTGRSGNWVAVSGPDGRAGWVHKDFIGPQRLTPDGLQAEIAAASDDATRLALWQRAAALQPQHAETMRGLAEAYRAVGRIEEADRVAATGVAATGVADSGSYSIVFGLHHAEVGAIGSELAAVGTEAGLVALWLRAQAVTDGMEEPLNLTFMSDYEAAPAKLDSLIRDYIPWATWTSYAEGTHLALELDVDVWTRAAERTAGEGDDALLAFMIAAYDNPEGTSWANWQAREWDYGGCSPFGVGDLHLGLLKQADALAKNPLTAPHVTRIRDEVLRDIEQPRGPGEFPYCERMGELTSLENLDAEAMAILALVNLSDAERRMIESRVAAKFEPREAEFTSE
jgi:hypothetical protein